MWAPWLCRDGLCHEGRILALAVGAYELNSSGVYAPHGVTVLTLEAERIEEIIHFRTPSMVESFGLPAQA